MFIQSVVDKCNVYNNCSKLRPPVAIHATESVDGANGVHVQRCQVFLAGQNLYSLKMERVSGIRFLAGHSGDSPFLPESLQLREKCLPNNWMLNLWNLCYDAGAGIFCDLFSFHLPLGMPSMVRLKLLEQ
ncbi:hypothetical protein TNCV_2309071 [Trichonephila clavipes]|nr:hypothetical protein TNCV_2309071 [Trichonephila clavipes]